MELPRVVGRPLHELTVEEARRRQADDMPLLPDDSNGVSITEIHGPVPIRLYEPQHLEPVPVCVWLPGGGWVLDTLAAADSACRRLARETPCAIAAVRYRLAPEHPFPEPLHDCVAALSWLAERGHGLGLDPTRLAIGGTSAGANLAAAVALVTRDRGAPSPAAQILVYPPLLHGADTESVRTCGDPSTLDRQGVEWCWSHYLSCAEDGYDSRASPLRAANLTGLPPALVLTAEHDPLRDEGELYARRLAAAGVEVELARIAGATHGFFSSDTEGAARAQRLVVSHLRRSLTLARALPR
ncbi:MAG: alpha/beta hydrolase [Actinobacteria bacterium]|nr:alpha/beta hydrolase [Actinomycetota bacterium]